MVVEQEMDEKWEVTKSLILSNVLITVSICHMSVSSSALDH